MSANKLKILVSDSTTFGLPNIVKREGIFSKIFWLIFVLLGTIASIFFTIETLNDYFEYETITKIEYKYQHPLRFPTFTICSDSDPYYFNRKKLKDLISNCEIKYDLTCKNNLDNYFELTKYEDMGTCCRFNSGKNVNGSLVPFLYSTVGGRDDYFELQFKKSIGLRIVIHEYDLPPKIEFYNIHETMFLLDKNFRYFIIIDKTIENKLGLPYNNCYENISDFSLNKTIINYIQSINQSYNQINCLKLCFELY